MLRLPILLLLLPLLSPAPRAALTRRGTMLMLMLRFPAAAFPLTQIPIKDRRRKRPQALQNAHAKGSSDARHTTTRANKEGAAAVRAGERRANNMVVPAPYEAHGRKPGTVESSACAESAAERLEATEERGSVCARVSLRWGADSIASRPALAPPAPAGTAGRAAT